MHLLSILPDWLHPRSPLIANSLRHMGLWDFRIRRFAYFILRQSVSLWLLALFALPFFMLVAIVANGPIVAALSLLLLVATAPLVVVISELFYIRLWFTMPVRASDAIAGEVQRGTWDILMTIPFPRHQLVLAKLAALGWMAEPSLIFILVMRATFLTGLFFFRLNDPTAYINTHLSGWALWMIILWIMPLFELFAVASLGLAVSAVFENPRQANLVALFAQIGFRLLAVSGMLLLVEVPDTLLVPAFAFPHWTFMPLQQTFPYSDGLIAGVFVMFILFPLLTGTLALGLAIQHIQNR